jgi:hypothetical protein
MAHRSSKLLRHLAELAHNWIDLAANSPQYILFFIVLQLDDVYVSQI